MRLDVPDTANDEAIASALADEDWFVRSIHDGADSDDYVPSPPSPDSPDHQKQEIRRERSGAIPVSRRHRVRSHRTVDGGHA
jgi:hypothetical protein